MNADGSNQIKLNNNSRFERDLAWSPDASSIVFSSHRDGNRQIYIMNADGSNQTRLTKNSAFDNDPVWAPK